MIGSKGLALKHRGLKFLPRGVYNRLCASIPLAKVGLQSWRQWTLFAIVCLFIFSILYSIVFMFFMATAKRDEEEEEQQEEEVKAETPKPATPVPAPSPAPCTVSATKAAAETTIVKDEKGNLKVVADPEYTYLYETYDTRSVEIFRGFILVYSYIGDAALRLPLVDDYYPYDETLELCEDHIFTDKDGNFYHLAAISETLHAKDKAFVQECRNKFGTKVRHATAERDRKQADWFRMLPEAEDEEKDKPAEERRSRARKGLGGYRKVWDGRVAKPEVNERPLPAKKTAPSSAVLVEKLENKVKILRLQKEARALVKEMVPKPDDVDIEDDAALAKLRVTHDFFIPSGMKHMKERVGLLATDAQSFTAEDLLAEEFMNENFEAMIQRVTFGKKTTIKLQKDARDHTFRSAGLYSDHFTLRDVSVEYYEYDDPSEEFRGWLWTLTLGVLIMTVKLIRQAIFWILTNLLGARVCRGWAIRKRVVEGKICWELYLELLSRKFISHKSNIEVGYQRMKTRYETYATLNLPSEMNGTGVLENSLNLAVCKYLVMNSYDLADFIDWTGTTTQEDSSENNTSFSDTIVQILRFPVSAQSRRVYGSRGAASSLVMRILQSPALLVLWYPDLFPRVLAEHVGPARSSACANVLALGIYLCLVQLYLTYNDSRTGMSKRITVLWLRMKYRQLERGWLAVIILLLGLVSSLKLRAVGAWMWMIMVWVVSIMLDQRALTASLRPSSIRRIKRLGLFVPGVITRSVSMVQYLLPLSASCMVLTTTSLNTFQSLIGPNTLDLSDWKVRLWLSPTTLLLSLILLRILCTPLNWFYTDICCRIFEIIADLISVPIRVLNSCLRLSRRLIVFAFWIQTISYMLLECLVRCSLPWAMDSLTLSSLYGCLIGVVSPESTVWLRAMTDSSWYPLNLLSKFLNQTISLAWALRSNLTSSHLLTVLRSVEWFLRSKPSISSAIQFGRWAVSAGYSAVSSIPVARLWDCVKQSFSLCFTSVTAALYSGLAPSEGSLFLKAYDQIGLKTIIDGTQLGPLVYFALNNLIVSACLCLALRIVDSLLNTSWFQSRSNSELSKRLRAAKTLDDFFQAVP